MKLYEKIIDGKQHCKPANKIVIVKDGMQTFNPTEEMLLEDGWKVHQRESQIHLAQKAQRRNQNRQDSFESCL